MSYGSGRVVAGASNDWGAGARNWLFGPQSLWGQAFGSPGWAGGGQERVAGRGADPRGGLPGYPAGTAIRGRDFGRSRDLGAGGVAPYDYSNMPQGFNAYGQYLDQAAQRAKQWSALRGNILGEYDDLVSEVNMLGEQERTDINTAFNNLLTSQQQDMTSRGIGSSTVLQGMRAGTNRQRADALGALEDRLRRNRIDVNRSRIGAQTGLDIGGYEARRADDMGALMFGYGEDRRNRNEQLMRDFQATMTGAQMGGQAMDRDLQYMTLINNLITGRQDTPFVDPFTGFLQSYMAINPAYVA